MLIADQHIQLETIRRRKCETNYQTQWNRFWPVLVDCRRRNFFMSCVSWEPERCDSVSDLSRPVEIMMKGSTNPYIRCSRLPFILLRDPENATIDIVFYEKNTLYNFRAIESRS